MAQIFVSPFAQYADASGNPGSGDKLYFYQTATTTLLTIYSDIGLSTTQANPVIADSAGQWPAVYLAEQLYKVVMKSAADVTIRTADPAGGDGVTGATSSTDNAVARFDGTTGHKLQNSGVIIDDSNNVTGVGNLTATALLGAGRPATFQDIAATGTWTKPAGCVRIIIEACGGGAGAGGIDGTAGANCGATGGGGSGFSGSTGILDVSAVVSAAVTIGAAGTAGDFNTAGGNGGNTAITIGAITYTWGGGVGSDFLVGVGSAGSMEGGAGGAGTNVTGTSQQGGYGIRGNQGTNTDNNVTGGAGGSSLYGTGGLGRHSFTNPVSGAGLAGTGKGAGGSGAFNIASASNAAGGAGTIGFMRIWEGY